MNDKGLWINNHTFVEFSAMGGRALEKEISSRVNAGNYWGALFSILPDPDTVLSRAGHSIQTYNNMMNDPHIFGEFEKRKALTTSLDFNILRGNASEKYSALIEEYLLSNDHQLFDSLSTAQFDEDDDGDIYDLIESGLEALPHGFQPVEIIWQKINKQWLPAKLIDRPREWFHFDQDGRLRFKSKGSPFQGELLPPKKFLVFRHAPTYMNPYGTRVLSKCFWAWLFKHSTEKWKIQFLEKFGSVWAIGKLPRGREDAEYNNMYDSLNDLINSGIGIIPDDGSIELMEPAGKGTTANIFDKNIDVYNAEMSKAILTVTSLTGSETGNRASDEVRERMVKALATKDKRIPVKRINRLLDWTFDLNAWGTAPRSELLEPEDYDVERTERDVKLNQQGVKFNKVYYQKHYSFEDDDFELEGEQPPAQFSAGEVNLSIGKDPLKEIIKRSSPQLQKLITPVLKPVLTVFETTTDLSVALEKITGMLPEANTDELEDLLTRLTFSAFAQGVKDAGR